MNRFYTPKSIVKKVGEDYAEVPRSLSLATRQKEVNVSGLTINFSSAPNGNNWFVPIYNIFNID